MINEGLKEGDLDGLVLNVISIDEYESKIDDSAMVIGFYVSYKDPASDLNKFIQKTNANIIDTDVSPAPTEDGFYIVFVELEKDKELIQNILTLVSNINNLVNISDWKFNIYGKKGDIDFNEENLKKYISIDLKNNKENNNLDENKIYDFFKESILDNLYINENRIIFNKNKKSIYMEYIDFDKIENIRNKSYMLNENVIYNFDTSSISNTIQKYIGKHWIVESIGKYISLRKNDEGDELIVRLAWGI